MGQGKGMQGEKREKRDAHRIPLGRVCRQEQQQSPGRTNGLLGALVQMLHPLPECFHIHAREACHPRVWPSRAPRETALRMNGDLYREPPALNKLAAWLSMPFLRRRALQRPSS